MSPFSDVFARIGHRHAEGARGPDHPLGGSRPAFQGVHVLGRADRAPLYRSLQPAHALHGGVFRRGSTTALGYGSAHRALRRRLAPLAASGQMRCIRCGEVILPGTAWDLGTRTETGRATTASSMQLQSGRESDGTADRCLSREQRMTSCYPSRQNVRLWSKEGDDPRYPQCARAVSGPQPPRFRRGAA
jgi:hypothetical protein